MKTVEGDAAISEAATREVTGPPPPGLLTRVVVGIAAGAIGWLLQQLLLAPGSSSPWWEDVWSESSFVADTIFPVTFALGALVVLAGWWGLRSGGLPTGSSDVLLAVPLAVLAGVAAGYLGAEISGDIMEGSSRLSGTDLDIAVQESTAAAYLVLGAAIGIAFGILTSSPLRVLLAGAAGAVGAGLASYVAYEVAAAESETAVRGYALVTFLVLGVAVAVVPGGRSRRVVVAPRRGAGRADEIVDERSEPAGPVMVPGALDLRDEQDVDVPVDRQADEVETGKVAEPGGDEETSEASDHDRSPA